MPTVNIAPVGRQQFFDVNGDPLSGGLLYTYVAGTTTKHSTYKTQAGSAANTNPIVLDANGYTPFGLWLQDGFDYKFTLAPADDDDPPTSAIWSEDVIAGVNDIPASGADQWIASGFTPTYISSTSFSVEGDQTTTLSVGRRLKIVNDGGTEYGHIDTSVFGSVTTLVMVMDAGDAIDSGIISVDMSIITAIDHSVPRLTVAQWVALGIVDAVIESGTVMLFFQASAPTLWTQVASNNDSAIRIVSGTGGGTGGSVAFETAFASQAVAGSNAGTSITISTMAAHTHTVPKTTACEAGIFFPYVGGASSSTSGSTGGGATHTHTFTGTPIDLDVQYIDVIYCSKD